MGRVPFAGGTPGVNLRTVLRHASAEDVEFLVGGAALRILKLLDGDLSQPDRLGEVAAKVADPTELLGHNTVMTILPPPPWPSTRYRMAAGTSASG
jgi:hypothetical protein